MVFLCSDSNIWENRMSFVRFFWNQLWLSFGWSTRKLKVFPGKVNLKERSVSYSKMNTLLFFLCFYFSRWLWNVFFVGHEKYFCLGEDGMICSSFKINTTSWVLHLTKNVRCFVLVVYFSYRPWYVLLLMERMTGAG